MRTVLRGVLIVFCVVFVIGLIQPRLDVNLPSAKSKATDKATPVKADPAFEAGFNTGFIMAKTGARKPSSATVDAMARRQAFDAGPSAGAAYKHNWKSGFWMGWSQGD